jgi:pseudaminic acid biosynthesis-associated methylase
MSETSDWWKGDFGSEYQRRNIVTWENRVPFWEHIVELTQATSFLDVGCACGWNMLALRRINENFEMSGLDVNLDALREAQRSGLDVMEGTADKAEELFGHNAAQVVVTSGVLIHVAPADLVKTMKSIMDASSQYVVAVEYDSPEEVEVNYRGHAGRLWKRPFGKLYEAMGLSLVETGEAQGFDSCQYWLMER